MTWGCLINNARIIRQHFILKQVLNSCLGVKVVLNAVKLKLAKQEEHLLVTL